MEGNMDNRETYFRLKKLPGGLYQIHSRAGKAFEGTPNSIFYQATKMGVQENHLKYSVNHMDIHGLRVADFTKYGTLIKVES